MTTLSTKHAVLGLMIDRSTYGYRLQHDVAERLGFLGLAESAIYKTIERLAAEGWVEEVGNDGNGRGSSRRRVHYRATPEGVEQFRAWMAEPSERATVREELHAKLALADSTDLPQLLAAAEEQAQECLAELAAIQRPPLVASDADELPWSSVAEAMIDDFKARWLEVLVDWLGEVCALIEQRIAQSERASP